MKGAIKGSDWILNLMEHPMRELILLQLLLHSTKAVPVISGELSIALKRF
jgi:hypothetical protein